MKYKLLQKWVMIRIVAYLMILGVIGGGYVLLSMQQNALVEERDRILSDTGALNDQLNTLRAKAAEIVEATKLWQQIPDKNKQGAGLRLEKIKILVDEYSKRYHIQDMNIDLSTPVELAEPYKTENAVAVASNVTLKFGSINDENILAFVDAILRDIPGYIKVRSFKMVREDSVSDTTLANIRKGLQPVLVNAEISFQWRDLKVTAEEKPKETNKPKVD